MTFERPFLLFRTGKPWCAMGVSGKLKARADDSLTSSLLARKMAAQKLLCTDCAEADDELESAERGQRRCVALSRCRCRCGSCHCGRCRGTYGCSRDPGSSEEDGEWLCAERSRVARASWAKLLIVRPLS